MTAAVQWEFVSESDYLAGELNSKTKHEYREGIVYAMAGARNSHNRIASNALGSLYSQLRGSPCEAFNSDAKIRIQRSKDLRYYYPDASVICESNPEDDSFQENPVIVVEVISESTRRIDEGEKREAYLSIPSLSTYLLIEQDAPVIQIWQRQSNGSFERTVASELDAVIPLPAIEAEIPLADFYERITFPSETT